MQIKTILRDQDKYLSSMIAILKAGHQSLLTQVAIDLITKVESYKGIRVYDDHITFDLHMEDWIELTNGYSYNIQGIRNTIGEAFNQLSQGYFYTTQIASNYGNILFRAIP
jgi:hypothetical protein